jgi:hypothetical protein
MGKVIPFKKNEKKIPRAYTMDDYLDLLTKVDKMRLDLELSLGYTEYYREYKTEEQYQAELICIEKDKQDLEAAEMILQEMEENFI